MLLNKGAFSGFLPFRYRTFLTGLSCADAGILAGIAAAVTAAATAAPLPTKLRRFVVFIASPFGYLRNFTVGIYLLVIQHTREIAKCQSLKHVSPGYRHATHSKNVGSHKISLDGI